MTLKSDGKKDCASTNRKTDDPGPAKEVLMPDIYIDEQTAADVSLDNITGDGDSFGIDTSRGFDPYDTGVLYKK